MHKYITIDGFENLTEQEIFDIALNHVHKNGEPSVRFKSEGNMGCFYAGIGCAASQFIKEDCRTEADENDSSWQRLEYNKLVPQKHSHFVARIQDAHDDPAVKDYTGIKFIRHFNSNMKKLAEVYKLNYKE